MPCSKKMLKCRSDCLHRKFVRDYQRERERQEESAWNEAIGYRTEYEMYVADHPLVTFKQWLIWNKRPERPETDDGPDGQAGDEDLHGMPADQAGW